MNRLAIIAIITAIIILVSYLYLNYSFYQDCPNLPYRFQSSLNREITNIYEAEAAFQDFFQINPELGTRLEVYQDIIRIQDDVLPYQSKDAYIAKGFPGNALGRDGIMYEKPVCG